VAVPGLGETLARVLALLGSEHALIVYGQDGLDELSVSAPSFVHEARRGTLRSYTVQPEDFGLGCWPREAVRGGTVDANLRLAEAVLAGETGAARDVVLLNAGAALYAADLADSIQDGIRRAADELDSGRARARVRQVADVSQRIRAEQAAAEVA
jgi:anthranilate phosphoribosyltransferase